MKKLIVIIILVIVCGYFGYKGYILNKYKSTQDSAEIDTSRIFNKTIEVPYHYSYQASIESLIDGSYMTGYEKKEDSNFYVLYDDNHEVKNYYSVSIMPEYINLLGYNYTMEVDNHEFVQEAGVKKFLINNNIKNDIDLLKYIKDNYYLKSNIFSTINSIKNNYMINEFVAITFSNFKSIDLISDNYGYIINIKDDLKEVHLLHNSKEYVITLGGEELTKEDFIDTLLGTISFD